MKFGEHVLIINDEFYAYSQGIVITKFSDEHYCVLLDYKEKVTFHVNDLKQMKGYVNEQT